MRRVFAGTVTGADRARSPYLYLPFEVDAGTTRIDLSYTFDEGSSILDLGLVDPQLAAFPALAGFRGWSGSFRREAFVALDDATPGYIPGEIPAGTWQVILGLARVAPEGCRYRVEVRTDGTPRTLIAPHSYPGVARTAPGLYRGDLQSHSYYSDARGSVEDLVAVARERGLDFLAVTDHNTHSHHRRLAELSSPDLLLVPGEEVTTYCGHANVWGLDGWADFRIHSEADLDTLIEQVHARGGLVSVNHPKATPNCLGCDWEYRVPAGIDSLEAWQGPWVFQNWESLARYDALLRAGRRVALVGGSDRHQPGYPDSDPAFLQLGSPTTWLWLDDLSTTSVLSAIRAGRGFVSESPAGPRLELSLDGARMGSRLSAISSDPISAQARVQGARGDRLHWVNADGVIRDALITEDDFTDEWDWQPAGTYLRLEVVAAASLMGLTGLLATLKEAAKLPKPLSLETIFAQPWRRALSNPVYLGRQP